MNTLDEIISKLDLLSPEARENLIRDAQKATRGFTWLPNPGPQTEAYFCLADELFYGGEAGGGKSDMLLGAALNSHRRSLILRRHNAEVAGLYERLEEILGTRKGLTLSPKALWRLPGRLIMFGGCQHLKDRVNYQGVPKDLICVGRDTPVLMGDGSLRPVQSVEEGEMVQTLGGPRRVLKSFPVRARPSVELAVNLPNGKIVRQIQSATHRVLTNEGWVSLGTMDGVGPPHSLSFSFSTRSSQSCTGPLMTLHRFLSGERALGAIFGLMQSISQLPKVVLSALCFLDQLGSTGAMAQLNTGTDFVVFGGGSQGFSPLQIPLHAQSMQPRPWGRSNRPEWPCFEFSYDGACDRKTSSLANYLDYCLSCFRSCGERPLEPPGHRFASMAAPQYPLQSICVGPQNPNDWPMGDGETIQRYSARKQSYAHPYTMAKRQSMVPLSLASWTATPVGSVELFDLEVEEVNHFITDGGIVNKNCFDEVSNFLQAQYEFIIAWNRSTIPGQRVRIIAAGNPPTSSEGMWVIARWAPWLDRNHPNPAVAGELRWFTTIGDDQNVEVEVDLDENGKPGPVVIDGIPLLDTKGQPVHPRSRTFIPAELSDNPDLAETGYGANLANLPKALRAGMMEGDFSASQEDGIRQLFPTAWIEAAQQRWNESGRAGNMTVLGVDVAQGGPDTTVLAPRHGSWFDHVMVFPGKDTPDGPTVAGLVFKHMRNGCEVILDMGGGYGISARDHLRQTFSPTLYDGSGGADNLRDRTNTFKFSNIRAAAHWYLMEALDPDHGAFLALPPDPMLKQELCSVEFEIRAGKIVVMPKEEIRTKLGRSPDRGDAVIMAHFAKGKTNHTRLGIPTQTQAITSGRNPNRRR